MPRRSLWLLKHRRGGDLAQMRHLAAMLCEGPGDEGSSSWAVEEKQLVFRFPKLVRLSSAAYWLLDSEKSDRLDQPWPDAIIVAERTAAWVAKALKARAGDQTKIIAVGRPAGQIASFDLILATAQYGLPAAQNVVTLPLPLATSSSARSEEREILLRRMAGKPRPWIAVLIGGSVPPDQLDERAVTQIAEAAHRRVRESGGSLMVLTSPRTGRRCEEDIRRSLHATDLLLAWNAAAKPNLYGAVLAEADFFLVTSDSISMTAEALSTGKPVSVVMLPQKFSLGLRFASALNQSAGIAVASPAPMWKLVSFLFQNGILEAPPDRPRFHRELAARGVLAIYPEFPSRSGAKLADEASAAAVSAVKKLLA
jgi:mitochondrial fission protein ELM1